MECRKKAMDLLARREHSRLELERKLISREYNEDEIKLTIDKLIQDDLQSDARFCEAYVQSRINKGFGPVKIGIELKERGVDESLAEEGLNKHQDSWIELAHSQQQKKFRTKPDDFTERARQARFLQNRGFSNEQIQHVLNNS